MEGKLGDWYRLLLKKSGKSDDQIGKRVTVYKMKRGLRPLSSLVDVQDAKKVLDTFLPTVSVDEIGPIHLHLVAMTALFRDSASLRHNSFIELRDVQVEINVDLKGEDLVVTLGAVLRTNIDIRAIESFSVNPRFMVDSKTGNDRTMTPDQLIPPPLLLKVIRKIVFRSKKVVRSNILVLAQFVALPRVYLNEQQKILRAAA
jgi:hypothetical protein